MAFVVLLFLLAGSASAKDFLGAKSKIDQGYINLVIQHSLDDVFGEGHGIQHASLASMNATLAPVFATLPKNQHGRLGIASMRYAVRRYFSERYGWVVKGFEPPSSNSSSSESFPTHSKHVHSDGIDQSQIPRYIEGVLQESLSRGGFALADVSVIVATIETLIFDKTIKSVEAAYQLRGLAPTSPINASDAVNVLVSYLILEHLSGDATDVKQHLYDVSKIGKYYPHWQDTLIFMVDIAGEFVFGQKETMNPFVTSSGLSFTFEDMAEMTRTISQRFGPFSTHECQDLKDKLIKIDSHGTGRVKLSEFYAAGTFREASKYLEFLGSLDTSSAWQGPQVIISNYLLGINNCITNGVYYDVCCLNECDGVYQHLEARIRSPTASASQIVETIEEGITLSHHLSASANTDARILSPMLRERLTKIEEHHGGRIPLHGRLLAQWLHYVFPRECPFPHLSGSVSRFYDTKQRVTKEEMQMHIKSDVGRNAPSPEAGWDMWSEQEELVDPDHNTDMARSSTMRVAAFFVMGVSLFAVVVKELMRLRTFSTIASSKVKVEMERATQDGVSYYI